MQVAVIGGGDSDPDTYMMARELDKRLAEKGHIVICGEGQGGIMEAVSCGAKEAGGLVGAILPGEKNEANRCIQIAIAVAFSCVE